MLLILGLEKVGFHGLPERRYELKAMRLCLWDESSWVWPKESSRCLYHGETLRWHLESRHFSCSAAPKARRFRSWQRCPMQWRKVCLAEWRSSKTCKKRWGCRSTLHLPESAWFYVPCVLACPCASACVTVNILHLIFLECMLVNQSVRPPQKKKDLLIFFIYI